MSHIMSFDILLRSHMTFMNNYFVFIVLQVYEKEVFYEKLWVFKFMQELCLLIHLKVGSLGRS